MEKLVEIYSDNSFPLQGLALSYHHFENYSEAAAQYLNASQRSNDPDEKTKLICSAAQEYAHDKDFKRAYDVINSEFNESSLSNTQMHRLYKALADVSKLSDNDLLFSCFNERALEIIPTDSDVRFSLAHKYGEINDHELSLYHYQILCSSKPDGPSWNNMGVAYRELNMNNKSINAYKKAVSDFSHTLAMANLSYQYIEQGFFDDARVLLNQAKDQADYHESIDSSVTRINQLIESEKKSEEKSLKSINTTQKFRQDFARAYVQPLDLTIDGKWQTKHGDIDITTLADRVTGILEIIPDKSEPRPQNALITPPKLGLLGLSRLSSPFKTTISLSGVIHNRTITYNIEKIVDSSSTLSSLSHFKFEGLMIISEDSLSMELMEREEENSYEFFSATKIELDD